MRFHSLGSDPRSDLDLNAQYLFKLEVKSYHYIPILYLNEQDPQHCTNHINKRYFLLHILAATGDCQMVLKVWFWLQFPLAYIEMSSTGTGMVLLVITLFSIPIRSGLPECAAHVSLHLVLHGPTEPQPLRGREGVCEPAGDLEWSGNRDLDPQLQPAPASRIHTG